MTNSVYHRTRLLSPLFPWLLFSNHFLGHLHSSLQFANAAVVYNYCGKDWSDANSKCGVPCPLGEDDVCPWGEVCFADCTNCPPVGSAPKPAPVLPPPLPPPPPASPGNNNLSTPANPNCDPATTDTINFGYYQSWAQYRLDSCFPQRPEEIPVSQFRYTHLAYSFAGISAGGLLDTYGGIDDEIRMYQQFNSLKATNPGLKTLIAVGGWNFDQSRFGDVASTPEKRLLFAESVVSFLIEHDFDGLDFDWEYPVTRQGTAADYVNYPLLVEAVRNAFIDGGHNFLLTMAIPINPDRLQGGFDLAAIASNLDWFNLMSYDIFGSWDSTAGSNTDMSYISMAVDYMQSQGVDPSKMALGLASYGRSSKLTDPTCTTAGCPINGAGLYGCSGEMGFSPYFELKEQFVDTGNYDSLLVNEMTGSMEMIVDGDIFVSFDLPQSFKIKYSFYLSRCFRGQMWWATDMIKEKVNFDGSSPSPPPPVTSPTSLNPLSPSSPTQVSAPGVTNDDSLCQGESGLVPTEDCSGFVFCNNGKMSGTINTCSPGLIFDANMGICNWPSETNLCGFEFCPNDMTGYVPFEECTKFYYCKAGKIDGDIDICADGTLFDVVLGICNWKSAVTCQTQRPTLLPTPLPTPQPTFASITTGAGGPNPQWTPSFVWPPSVQAPIPEPVTFPGRAPEPAIVPGQSPGSVGSPAQVPIPEPANIPGQAPTFVLGQPQAPINTPAPISTPAPTKKQDLSTLLRFDPSDDAYVQEENPTTNFNDNYIVVDQNLRFDGLLRFYIQGLEGRKITYIKLRLYVSNPSYFGGNFYACYADWHEDVVTWETVPSVISQQPLAIVNAVIVEEWIEVDVTGLATDDGPVALRIISDDPDNVMYSSKENPNGNSPMLLVGVEPKPMQQQITTLNTVKIGPTDDAFIFMITPDKNYGSLPDLKVDVDNGVKNALLRFDFSRVDTASIKQAILRVYATDSSPSGGSFVKTTSTDWDEDTVTWSNSPSADSIVLGRLDEVIQGYWYELDITSAVVESAPFSIRITGSHDDRVMYSSKEGENSPEIVLTLQEAVTEGEIVELFPTDDATIVLQQRSSNFGGNDVLETDARDGLRNFLLRFDASAIPQGEVKSAVLRIYARTEETAFGGTFVEVMDSNWNEQTVTWDNAPSGDGRVLGSLMEIEGGTWYDIDVTTAVMGGSAVSFRVSSPHTSIAIYGSKESDEKPYLIVHYSAPEPIPEGVQIFKPSDDASILMEKADGNFGLDHQLKIDGDSGVFNSLLRFDLTSVEKDTVTQAILRLYAIDGSPSGGTFIASNVTNWSQFTVTWNTAPPANGIVLATLDDVIPYKWYQIDVTELAHGGAPITIRIAPSHGNRCAYSSREDIYGRAPQLLVTADMFKGME